MGKHRIFAVILIVAAASWLTTLVDNGLGLVWTENVVRNWEQDGFFKLHGQLVYNPGGYQVDTQPQIYPGHRPASLYPFFLVQTVFRVPWAVNLYYALVAAVVFLSIWLLLGRTDRAFWLAGIAVLTPGYLRWQTTLDPNLASVLGGFPFCFLVIWLLRKGPLNLSRGGLLLALIFLYSAINWSTAFIHAMLLVALLFLPGVSRKNVVLYVVLAAVPAILIVATSVLDKMTTNHHGSGEGFARIYADYGWGSAGYGVDLGSKTAFLRLLFVNFIGLLPVTLFMGWEWWSARTSGPTKNNLSFLLPFLASLFSVAALRNYFGHHPWMSCNFILLGMILSFVVWKSNRGATSGDEKFPVKPVWQWVMLGAAFGYGLVVLSFYHIHNGPELALMKLVRTGTPRSATIVITRDSDPGLAGMEERLQEPFDRHIVVLDTLPDSGMGMTNGFWLTAASEKRAGYQLVAASAGNEMQQVPLAGQMLAWYNRAIAHRRAGDKLDVGEQYYLYR
jgi:hypothetical protein